MTHNSRKTDRHIVCQKRARAKSLEPNKDKKKETDRVGHLDNDLFKSRITILKDHFEKELDMMQRFSKNAFLEANILACFTRLYEIDVMAVDFVSRHNAFKQFCVYLKAHYSINLASLRNEQVIALKLFVVKKWLDFFGEYQRLSLETLESTLEQFMIMRFFGDLENMDSPFQCDKQWFLENKKTLDTIDLGIIEALKNKWENRLACFKRLHYTKELELVCNHIHFFLDEIKQLEKSMLAYLIEAID